MKKLIKSKLIKDFINEKGLQISSDALNEINNLFSLLIKNFMDNMISESTRLRRRRIMIDDVHALFSVEYKYKPG